MITRESEKQKYDKIWAFDLYRKVSPGEQLIDRLLADIPWKRGERLIDFGCGTGRAGLKFSKLGLAVTLFDLCPSALDLEAFNSNLKFLEGCLWDEKDMAVGVFDWIFCCDVLEHIPTEHIDKALDLMAAATGKGGMLQIAMFPDGCGSLIGENLHLTVKPATWWLERIKKRWTVRASMEDTARIVLFLDKPPKEVSV